MHSIYILKLTIHIYCSQPLRYMSILPLIIIKAFVLKIIWWINYLLTYLITYLITYLLR